MAPCLPGPPHVLNVLANEAGERFCYYGLRAILTLYLVDVLGQTPARATSTVSFWIAGTYLSPVLGGYLADAVLGRYRTILAFNAIYTAGALALVGGALSAAPAARDGLLFLGLALVAVGTGGIKANILPFGVDQLAGLPDRATTSFVLAFYACINLGSLASYLVMPLARARAGWPAAFALPAAALGLSLVAFLSARRRYVHAPPAGSVLSRAARVCLAAARAPPPPRGGGGSNGGGGGGSRDIAETTPLVEQPGAGTGKGGGGGRAAAAPPSAPPPPPTHTCLDRAAGRVDAADLADVAAVVRLAPFFAVLPVFWSLYDQTGVTWTLQARRMELHGLEADQVQALNALLVVLFVPPYDAAVRALMAGRWPALRPTPLRRMAAGCFLATASFAVSGALEAALSRGARPSVAWQLPQYALMTVAELCVSTTGLEFFFREAPASMKGLIMAGFFLTTTAGDLLNGVLYRAVDGVLTQEQVVWLFTALMLAAAVAFAAVAARYRPAPPPPTPPTPADARAGVDDAPAAGGEAPHSAA